MLERCSRLGWDLGEGGTGCSKAVECSFDATVYSETLKPVVTGERIMLFCNIDSFNYECGLNEMQRDQHNISPIILSC